MRDISEAIVAGTLQALCEKDRADERRYTVVEHAGNRAERRRAAAIERRKKKRPVGSNAKLRGWRNASPSE